MTDLILHPAVARQFVQTVPDARFRFFPVSLDVKQTEVLRTLLVNQRDSCIVNTWDTSAIPVFLSTHPQLESLYIERKPALSVIIDLHDKGRKLDFLGLTDPMWQTIEIDDLQVLYFKLQVHDPAKYRELNRLPNNLHLLSMPLLLGGSRFHITVQDDFEGDALFSRTLKPNPDPTYEYDWSWVGAYTSDDRKSAWTILDPYTARKRFFSVSQPGHLDANVASIPMPEYLRISRASKVNLSLNGRGPWCLKDGELLANDCLVLRQWHPSIDLNPLTPIDGQHWVVFKTEQAVESIEHLLMNDQYRESIRASGFEYFRKALLENAWSDVYMTRMKVFVETKSKAAWSKLSFG